MKKTKKWVVVVGTMFGNKTIHGPFTSQADMSDWIESYGVGQPCEIVELLGHGVL